MKNIKYILFILLISCSKFYYWNTTDTIIGKKEQIELVVKTEFQAKQIQRKLLRNGYPIKYEQSIDGYHFNLDKTHVKILEKNNYGYFKK